MFKARYFFAGVLTLAALAVSAWLVISAPGKQIEALENATVLPESRPITEFTLSDEKGTVFTRDDLRGRWTLLFFGFTSCPDVCPITLQTLAAARRSLQQQGHDELPGILFVSVDPERDTQDAIAEYVANFGDGVKGVRGDIPALKQLTGDLGIFFAREPATGESYDISHSGAVMLINPESELHAVFSSPPSVPALVHDLPIIMASR